jgi:hypothetical protein
MAVQPIIINFNTAQLIIGGFPLYINPQPVYTDSGSGSTIPAGTVMGRVFATGKVIPLVSSATDGSENPIGILAESITAAASASVPCAIVYGGEIASNLIVFSNGTDTLATTVGTQSTGGTLLDMITRNTQLAIITTTDLSNYDNPIN